MKRPHPATLPKASKAKAPAGALPAFRPRVLALVARIPRGSVATYGQIAALAGYPRRARHVGQVLAGLAPGHDLPWQRVINAQGRVSPRGGGSGRAAPRGGGEGSSTRRAVGVEHRQQRLLKSEGVRFKGGKVDLARYRWQPIVDESWARGLGGR